MPLPYFDLHCDTAYEMVIQNQPLEHNNLHISLERARRIYAPYCQVFAVWSNPALEPAAQWAQYNKIVSNFKMQAAKCGLPLFPHSNTGSILSVEGATLLEGDLGRLEQLYADGVRVLTLTWGGVNDIGGAWDTSQPFTAFGLELIRACEGLGVVVDLSHANDGAIDQALAICRRPVMASHSNARAVCGHPRNLSDRHFAAIRDRMGVVGISLHNAHLLAEGADACESLERHIAHYLSLGGEEGVALGFDLDGCTLPEGVDGIGFAAKAQEYLRLRGYGEGLLDKIFYRNACKFFDLMI